MLRSDATWPLQRADFWHHLVLMRASAGYACAKTVCTRSQVVLEHPPILSYSPTELLLPVIDYLRSLGFNDPAEVVRRRPTLLGLAPEALVRIVEYLQANDYTSEQIAEYLQTSL